MLNRLPSPMPHAPGGKLALRGAERQEQLRLDLGEHFDNRAPDHSLHDGAAELGIPGARARRRRGLLDRALVPRLAPMASFQVFRSDDLTRPIHVVEVEPDRDEGPAREKARRLAQHEANTWDRGYVVVGPGSDDRVEILKEK